MAHRTVPQRNASSRWKGPRAERRQRRQRLVRLEWLEPRLVLDGLGAAAYGGVSAEWFAAVPQIVAGVADAPAVDATAVSGPVQATPPAQATRWIVRLTEQATAAAGAVQPAEHLLDTLAADFQVLRGLGLPGQLLVRSFAPNDIARTALAANPHVASFEPEALVFGQTIPADPQFGDQTGLHNDGRYGGTDDADIDATEAWSTQTGSRSVVVGVIDSGVDLAHEDLYENIWINQAEIPQPIRLQLQPAGGPWSFAELNAPGNLSLLEDWNQNGRRDAYDVLYDDRWADGRDTDENGFVDDFFGWDFRQNLSGSVARSRPNDANGHGSHVAGIIGARGNNNVGVTGVAWQTSLMVLKVLDENNAGLISDALAAVNYATLMRTRAEAPVNVRVLNASWGQAGAYSAGLEAAIREAGDAGILFVAAAGNGNVLGQGVNNDQVPFYPASYELDNVISVAATDRNDHLAPFSNYGRTSVDLAAPGVGVLSTVPGDRYEALQGTSMAAPHVSGVAALVWSEVADATVAEVRGALLGSTGDPLTEQTVDTLPRHADEVRLATGGRVNAAQALQSKVFAPRVASVYAPDVTTQGGTYHDVWVTYKDRTGLSLATLDSGDVQVTRSWGPSEPVSVALVTKASATSLIAGKYRIYAPGGTWDAADYGTYHISLNAGEITNANGLSAPAGELGSFQVRIADSTVFYVNSTADEVDASIGDGFALDALGATTLRAAIQEANAAGAARTIIVEPATYILSRAGANEDAAATGDLDVSGDVTLLGDQAQRTLIDAAGLDRVFDVRPGASLRLDRVTLRGGSVAGDGGGVFNQGNLELANCTVTANAAVNGGGVAVWPGGALEVSSCIVRGNDATTDGGGIYSHEAQVDVQATLVSQNNAAYVWTDGDGGGMYLEGGTLNLSQSTLSENRASFGGGLYVGAAASARIVNTTISANQANYRKIGSFNVSSPGGIAQNGGEVTLAHVTVTDNVGPGLSSSAGGVLVWDGVMSLSNSLVAGNVGGLEIGLHSPGTMTSLGHNLVGTSETGDAQTSVFREEGDQIDPNASAFLGPLQDHGGATPTHALLPRSSAIDGAVLMIDPISGGIVLEDQRGRSRFDEAADGDGDGSVEADIGAFENVHAEINGVVFQDLDGDRARDVNEPGLPGRTVFLDSDQDGQLDPGEPRATTRADDPATAITSEAGTYSFSGLAPGLYHVAQTVESGWEQTVAGSGRIALLSQGADGSVANGPSASLAISGDGRFVAFVSSATNLDGGQKGVFVVDRHHATIKRISNGGTHVAISADGRFVADQENSQIHVTDLATGVRSMVSVSSEQVPGNGSSSGASLSDDGRFVAFLSNADNLVPGDGNGKTDAFVRDLVDGVTQRVSIPVGGGWANSPIFSVAISGDGRFVAFVTDASNLVPGDNLSKNDVFLYDRQTSTLERIDVTIDGAEPDDHSEDVSLSYDGRLVAFASSASNLVEGDGNETEDVFVLDRVTQTIQRVGQPPSGGESNRPSVAPSISGNGRYLAFLSFASNLVPNDTNSEWDVFVYDRQSGTMERMNVTVEGVETFGLGRLNIRERVDLSQDGRTIGFISIGLFVTDDDTSPLDDVFVRSTVAAGAAPSFPLDLRSTLITSDTDFGTRPNSGEIRGRVFEDGNADAVREWWEDGLVGWTVYLDLNQNGGPDAGEPTAVTAADDAGTPEADEAGTYAFASVAALQEYTVALVPQAGWIQRTPGAATGGAWQVYVGAGAAVTERNFGSRRDGTTGQTGTAAVEGIVFQDLEHDGRYDGDEPVVAGAELYLDLDDNGIRNDEPRTRTGADGRYSFGNLGSLSYAVRLEPGNTYDQSSPRGNQLTRQQYALTGAQESVERKGDVLLEDFNGDNLADLAVARYSNKVSLLLNDGHGAFLEPGLTIPTSPAGLGPIALAAGQFNADPRTDLAVANHLNSTVTVLLDFDPQTGSFAPSPQVVAVGAAPRALAAANLDGDADLDLVVAGEYADDLTILRNDGSGTFSPDGTRLSVGQDPVAVLAVDLDADGDRDLAVACFGNQPNGADEGQLYVLRNLGGGAFAAPAVYQASPLGSAPSGLAAADFDQDGRTDLAVANLVSNNVTVFRGTGSGSFDSGVALAAGFQPNDIVAKDMDGDQDVDLVVAGGGGNTVSILRNRRNQQGTFGFEPPENYGAANFEGSETALGVGDCNGDGLADLALASARRRDVSVLANQLLAGAHRVALAGSETVGNLDFGLEPIDTALKVASFTATSTGFEARFNRNLTAGGLNLYDQGGALGLADVTLVGNTVGAVRGSLVVDPNLRQVAFIKTGAALEPDDFRKTGGVLEPDTYTVTLVSGVNAFRDAAGNLLDGNGDGTAGDNYTTSFVVPAAADNTVTVSLPDFARGYGQSVNLPANNPAAGLPLQVSNGLGVSRLQFTLRYDPSLLEVQAFTLSSSLVDRGGQALFQVVSPGTATLDITAVGGFAAASGPLTVGAFTATVPATAMYGAKHVLDIADLHVFDTGGVPAVLPAVDDDAIHVAAFFGDNNGSRTYNAPDVTLNQRLIGLINTGLSAYQLADPLLLADITRNGQLQANDTVGIQRLIGQVPVANVPPLPTFSPGFTPPAASGADPKIYIPQDLAGSPGDTVTVPVRMHVTEPAGITLSGFDLVIEYDPARLAVSDAQIGSLLTGMGFVGSRLQLAPGVLIYTAGSGKPPEQLPVLPLDQNGDIVTLTVTILEGAAPGPAAINLRASYTGTDTRTTAAFDRDLNDLVLAPAPTNGPNDSVDGLLNVIATARLDVPQDLSGQRGQSVTVPVRLTVTEPGGTTISGFEVVARYDPTRFTLAGAQLGTLFSGAGFLPLWNEPVPGTVIYTASFEGGTALLPLATQADLFTLSLTVKLDAPLGVSPVNLLSSSGGTTTALYNNNLDELSLYPPPTDSSMDNVDGLVTVEDALTLIVTRLTPTAAGFVAEFNRELGTSFLNLYDGAGGELGPSDAILQNGSGNPVLGSLVLGSNPRTVEFVKTGSPLAPGDYTVLLKSGSTAFRDAAGNLLDGNWNGTPGDDFTLPLTVAAADRRVLSVPDFARGAGQPVYVPASAAGLPIRISSADAVTSVAVDVVFDPALLQITAAALAAGLPGDWSVTRFDTSTSGLAKITAAGTTPLSGSDVEIIRLAGTVPNAAPYGASQAIRLATIAVNGGALAAVGDVAVHKAAYLGDADGSGIHSSADAFLTVQAALGLASGFAAHAWTDPRIAGDADGSGVLSAADAFLIVQEGLGLPEPFVPDNPHITVTHVSGGIDPRFQIAVDIPATAGDWVSVPVQLDIEPAANNVGAIEFEIFFDPSRLTIAMPAGVLAGADTAGQWAISATSVAAGQVRISMLNAQGQTLAAGLREIARLVFRVDAAATEGVAPVDIRPWDVRAGGFVWTDSDGSLLIGPAPSAGGDNSADRRDVNGDGEACVHDAALCRLLDQQDEQRGAREEEGEEADEWLWGLLGEDL